MKNLLTLFIIIALCSCKDDTQNLLNGVSGKWKVSSATFKYGSTVPDSVVNSPSDTFIEFVSCKTDNNNLASESLCDAFYTEGGKSYPFKYFVRYLQNNYSELSFSTTKAQNDLKDKEWQKKADIFLTGFAVENYTKTSMTLSVKSKGKFAEGIVIKLTK